MLIEAPEGWVSSPLADVVTVMRNGFSCKQEKSAYEGYVPVSRIETISSGKIDASRVGYVPYEEKLERYRIYRGDILFSHINSVEHIAKIAFAEDNQPFFHAMNLMLLRPKQEVIVPFYLAEILRWERTRSYFRERCKRAVNQVSLNQKNIGDYEFPLPPLNEQDRIAKILTSVDDSIHATEAVIAQAERVKRGLMEDLLTGGLGSEAIANGEAPDGWRRTSLSDLCIVQAGAGFPNKQQGINGERYPFYKVSDMNTDGNEVFMTKANNSVSEEVRVKLGAKVFPVGSIIFPKIGAAIATNKKRIITVDSLVDNNVMGLIPKTDEADRSYVYYFMLMKNLSDFASSAGVPSMRKSTVEECPICVPSVEEQRSIAKTLESMDEQIAGNLKTVNQLQRLKRGLMDDLLTGRVRTV